MVYLLGSSAYDGTGSLLFDQVWKEGLHAIDHSPEVGIKQRFKILPQRSLVQSFSCKRGRRSPHSSIKHQNSYFLPAKLGIHFLLKRLQRGELGYVRLNRKHLYIWEIFSDGLRCCGQIGRK